MTEVTGHGKLAVSLSDKMNDRTRRGQLADG
jgi:hypothetical protein